MLPVTPCVPCMLRAHAGTGPSQALGSLAAAFLAVRGSRPRMATVATMALWCLVAILMFLGAGAHTPGLKILLTTKRNPCWQHDGISGPVFTIVQP